MAYVKIKYETFHKNDHKNKYPTEKIISKMEVSLKISLRNNVNFGGYVRNGDIDVGDFVMLTDDAGDIFNLKIGQQHSYSVTIISNLSSTQAVTNIDVIVNIRRFNSTYYIKTYEK